MRKQSGVEMRLWSIHPKYLDGKGLVALWREGLLAKKVLAGKTQGYKHHPQLLRFKNCADPLLAIESYLYFVYLEAQNRNYTFDKSKLTIQQPISNLLSVTSGQVRFERLHLCQKLQYRDKARYRLLCENKNEDNWEINPLFYLVEGEKEFWEKYKFSKHGGGRVYEKNRSDGCL